MNKGYERPTVMAGEGLAEGVFMASGTTANCDCFVISGIMQRHNGDGYFACNYEIHYNEGASHMDGVSCWNDVKVTVTLNNAVPAGTTLNPNNGVINGNQLVFTLATVSPATTGNLSYNFFELKGSGLTDLKVESIVANH